MAKSLLGKAVADIVGSGSQELEVVENRLRGGRTLLGRDHGSPSLWEPGSVKHLAGMRDSKVTASVNKDEPMCLVADLYLALPPAPT